MNHENIKNSLIKFIFLLILIVPMSVSAIDFTDITRISLDSNKIEGNGASSNLLNTKTVSDDGRFVVFVSSSSNLVGGDTNGKSDIFLRDIVDGTTKMVNIDNNGDVIDIGDLPNCSISGNGQYVYFVTNDSNSTNYVYSYNRLTEEVKQIASSSEIPNFNLYSVSASYNGDYAVISTPFLLFGMQGSVYLYNNKSDELSSIAQSAQSENGVSGYMNASISNDGKIIIYSEMLMGSTGSVINIVLYNIDTSIKDILVTGVSIGNNTGKFSMNPLISGDGKHLVYITLDTIDTNTNSYITYSDLETKETKNFLIDKLSNLSNQENSLALMMVYPSISNDGRYVSFSTTPLLAMFDPGQSAIPVYLYDIENNKNIKPFDSLDQFDAILSGDGKYITFMSSDANLIDDDTNNNPDIFLASNPLYKEVEVPEIKPIKKSHNILIGTPVMVRYLNLISMGHIEDAEILKSQFPSQFVSSPIVK